MVCHFFPTYIRRYYISKDISMPIRYFATYTPYGPLNSNLYFRSNFDKAISIPRNQSLNDLHRHTYGLLFEGQYCLPIFLTRLLRFYQGCSRGQRDFRSTIQEQLLTISLSHSTVFLKKVKYRQVQRLK